MRSGMTRNTYRDPGRQRNQPSCGSMGVAELGGAALHVGNQRREQRTFMPTNRKQQADAARVHQELPREIPR
jgi:hypothetical protein